jgi:hypothetical protein
MVKYYRSLDEPNDQAWVWLDGVYRTLEPDSPDGVPVGQALSDEDFLAKFVADLDSGTGFRSGLRVKGVKGIAGSFEMTWADDGRAIFTYGEEVRPGEPHVIWQHIGTHSILP